MKILISLLLILSVGFSASTNWQRTSVADKAYRTIPLALGAALAVSTTGTDVTANLAIPLTTGNEDLPQIISITNTGVAITTINVIANTNMSIGDVILLQSVQSTNDYVIVDDGSTIYLGAATRSLTGLSDVLILQKFSSTALREISFTDNE